MVADGRCAATLPSREEEEIEREREEEEKQNGESEGVDNCVTLAQQT